MINLACITSLAIFVSQGAIETIDRRVSAAMESGTLQSLYGAYVSDARTNIHDPLPRYGAVTAYCKMRSLMTYKLGAFDIAQEYERAKRMSDQAILLEPRKAYPLLAKIYLLSSEPESLGPRPPGEASRKEYQWQTITNTKTGEVKRQRILVYYYDDEDPRLTREMKTLVEKALQLEPANPGVLLMASQIELSAVVKLKYLRAAAGAGAKEKFPTTYLFAAYKAYKANKNTNDASIAAVALRKRLLDGGNKMWAKLFRKQYREFAKS